MAHGCARNANHRARRATQRSRRVKDARSSKMLNADRQTGAGNGLFAKKALDASDVLFTVPASALMNTLTLGPHYPQSRMLSCTQIICLHLMLHRGEPSSDPHFGPYLAVLPRDFNFHPFSWLWSRRHACETEDQRMLLDSLPPGIHFRLSRMMELYRKDWKAVKKYLVC